MISDDIKLEHSVLYGQDQILTTRGLAASGLLFVISYIFWRLPGISESAYEFLPVDVIGGGFAALLVIAAIQAFYNKGIIVSWSLVLLPTFGASVNFVGVGLQSGDPLLKIGLILGLPMTIALILGSTGFLVGRGIDYIVSSAGDS